MMTEVTCSGHMTENCGSYQISPWTIHAQILAVCATPAVNSHNAFCHPVHFITPLVVARDKTDIVVCACGQQLTGVADLQQARKT